MEEIRWHYRFRNFSRAFHRFKEPLESSKALSDLEREGAIQRFKYTFELAWKLLKDYLEYSGVEIDKVTPRNVIKEAFAAKLIDDGNDWIDMLDARNDMSHMYDVRRFEEVEKKIRSCFLGLLEKLHEKLDAEIDPK